VYASPATAPRRGTVFIKHSLDSFGGQISPVMIAADRRQSGRNSFADPRITPVRHGTPIMSDWASSSPQLYKTICGSLGSFLLRAPQDRNLITRTNCAVRGNVAYRIDALFIATETLRNFAAGCHRIPRARKDASRDSAFARCLNAILPNILYFCAATGRAAHGAICGVTLRHRIEIRLRNVPAIFLIS
jgi:hypothetical protein